MNPPAVPRSEDPADSDAALASVRSPARLDAVRRSGLLDSEPEEAFDGLTRLAARLLQVPASFISVVDFDRDFYKSQVGFDGPVAQERQLEGRTFCHYTLAGDEMLVIDDTHADPVWQAVSTVQTLGVRAYLGAPLKLDAQTIGSFCVIDTKPRAWRPDELEILKQLAVSAGRELSLRAALAAAREEVEHARVLARSREELIAIVAHDLRNPLQVLDLSMQLMRGTGDEGHPAIVKRMETAIDSMRKMADEWLTTTAAVQGPASGRRQRVSAQLLVQEAVDMMSPIAGKAGIHLSATPLAQAGVTVDYAQMLRVLGNLIGNSIKYSQPGGSVTVGAARDGDTLLLTVADNGKGMTREERDRAFERGWQGAAGMVRGDGAGLGLSIVKSLVSGHGGSVEIESEPGRGTILTVRLPCE